MKYQHQEKVLPQLADKSKRDIDAVNAYIDSMRGVVISIERIRSGQPRPYADSVRESLIFLHQPNSFTTNAPMVRSITEEEARVLAKIFVGSWVEDRKHGLESRLDFIRPEKNPCGLEEYSNAGGEGKPIRSSCWRVQITEPYCD